MSVPCLFAIEFRVLEFWLCRSVLKHSINKRNQSQGLPIDISVQLQACFCSYMRTTKIMNEAFSIQKSEQYKSPFMGGNKM